MKEDKNRKSVSYIARNKFTEITESLPHRASYVRITSLHFRVSKIEV